MDTQCHPLIYRGIRRQPQTTAQGRLTDQEEGGRGAAVHAGAVVAQHAQILELFGLQEVALLDQQEHASAAFGLGQGECLGGLGDETGAMEAGRAAERADDESE
jgi:hypothetical protein